jgi:hypothetical protein
VLSDRANVAGYVVNGTENQRVPDTPQATRAGGDIDEAALLRPPYSQSRHDRALQSDLTYGQRLSVAWLLIWRGAIILAVINLVTVLPVWIAAFGGTTAIERFGVILSSLTTLVVAVFLVMPWLVGSALKKRFQSFSLGVIRRERRRES